MPENSDNFPVTRHSVIVAVQSDDPDQRSRALGAISAAYWKPIYKHMRLRWHADATDAQDLTQEFFTRLIEKDFLDAYDSRKGRLRTFLRTCADRFYLNHTRDAHRLKRGMGHTHEALNFEEAEREHSLRSLAASESVEDYFEKEWVRSLFALALQRLRRKCEKSGKMIRLALFERYDLADESSPVPSYADLAREFDIPSTDVTNHLAFARREFRQCVLDQLRDMTATEEEFRAEARALLGVFPK